MHVEQPDEYHKEEFCGGEIIIAINIIYGARYYRCGRWDYLAGLLVKL